MTNTVLIFIGLIGLALFLLSTLLVRVFRGYALTQELLDIPNNRSSHVLPTPKGGGLVFVTLWLITVSLSLFSGFFSFSDVAIFLPGTILVAILGFWDDKKDLSAKRRIVIQFGAAALSVWMLPSFTGVHLFGEQVFNLGWFAFPLLILGITWSTNLFNFMDGLDGIASIEALFVLGVGGIFFWIFGEMSLAFLAWSLVLGVAGFLVWNWPSASVFMGGVGSYSLGFLIGLFAVVGDVKYQIPIMLWIILYGTFWFDATITLLRRMLYKQAWTKPHRSHAYQRLHQAGFSHKQVIYWVIGLNSVLAGLALSVAILPQWMEIGFLLAILVLTLAYGVVEKLKPMAR